MIKDDKVFDFCRGIIEDDKLTQDEVYGLSECINKQVDDDPTSVDKWPNKILIGPLDEVWSDGVLNVEELQKLAEILVSIVYNNKLEVTGDSRSNNASKNCPHCNRVLMTSLIPRCSWCGADLKEDEMYVPSEDWVESKKIEDAWSDVLSDKQSACYNNWFGRLYAGPRIGDTIVDRGFRRWGKRNDGWSDGDY